MSEEARWLRGRAGAGKLLHYESSWRKSVDDRTPNAGLLLDQGTAGNANRSRGDRIGALLDAIASQPPPAIYARAYRRWKSHVTGPGFKSWEGRTAGPLFIGAGQPSLVDAAVTLDLAYGMPVIPGSTLKGLVRAEASALWRGATERRAIDEMLGTQDLPGLVTVHDGWWRPGSASTPFPFVREVVTQHGKPLDECDDFPTGTESPVPAPQLAVRGAFLFAVEGPPDWARAARDLLRRALIGRGTGRGRPRGHGFFEHDHAEPDAEVGAHTDPATTLAGSFAVEDGSAP